MENSTGNIEKELFLEQEPCPKKIKDKKTAGKKSEKQIIGWKPIENVRKGLDTDELGFKCIVAILIVISPFILLYELCEGLWFRCSTKRRQEEFRKMERESVKYAKKHSPTEEHFYRNHDQYIINYPYVSRDLS